MNAIEVRGLRKSYGVTRAVDGIDFVVPVGKVFAFLGPNGAGKTTTVEILEGHRNRDSGEVRVLGFDPAKGETRLRQRVGIVLQECGFPRHATVRELVKLQATYYPNPRPVDETIELVGLQEKRNQMIRLLSGGQQRRLDLALALVGNPDLIFLDEPTTGFDPTARHEAWEAIKELCELGKTIFLTTHYMDEAQHLADHIAVIVQGRIVAEGTPQTIGGRDTARTHISFAAPSLPLPDLGDDEVHMHNGIVNITTAHSTVTLHILTQWAVNNQFELTGLSVSQPSLEDIYLQLTSSVSKSADNKVLESANK